MKKIIFWILIICLIVLSLMITSCSPKESKEVKIEEKAGIAFGLRSGNTQDDIWMIGIDDHNLTQLTNYPGSEWLLDWSPDSTQVLFTSDRDGRVDLYLINRDGTNLTRLTDSKEREEYASFSPDGSKILFIQWNEEVNGEIWVMNKDGSQKTNLTNTPTSEFSASWSPDGSKIVYVGYESEQGVQIYTMNADGSNRNRLTSGRNNYYPVWSPDGTKILFVSERDSSEEMIFPDNTEIYLMNSNGTGQKRLTRNPGNDCYPSFSPDGRKIAFINVAFQNANGRIYVMNSDGNNPTLIGPEEAYLTAPPRNYGFQRGIEEKVGVTVFGEFTPWRWSRDGRIPFVAGGVFIMDDKGGNLTELFRDENQRFIFPCMASP
jgi:TolB protein